MQSLPSLLPYDQQLILSNKISAAQHAARRCAYAAAIKHYRQAKALLSDLSDAPADQFFQIGLGLASALKFIGEFAEADQVLSELLQRVWVSNLALDPPSLSDVLVKSLAQMADIRQHEGAFDQALAYLEVGRQVLGEAGEQSQPQLCLLLLDRKAWVRFRQGYLAEALSLANAAIQSSRAMQAEDPDVLASLHNTLGGIMWQQGNLAAAITHVEQSLQLSGSLNDLRGMAVANGNLGILYFNSGNWAQAIHYYEQAYAVQQVIGNWQGQATSLDNLGLLHMAMGQHETAQQELEAGLAIRRKLGDAWGTAQSQINLAHLAVTRSNFKDASQYIESALSLADSTGSFESQIEARWTQALISLEKNDLLTAIEIAETALERAQAAGLMEKHADCLRVMGVVNTRLDRYDEAERALLSSVDFSEKQNAPYRRGQALLTLGQMYQLRSQLDSSSKRPWRTHAVSAFSRAAQLFEKLGATHDLDLAQTALNHLQGT